MGQAAPKMCYMQEVTMVPMQEGPRGGSFECGEWRAVDGGSYEAQLVGCGDSCSSKAGCPQDSDCCLDPADSRVEEVLVVHHKAFSAVRYMLQTDDLPLEGPGPSALPGAVVAMRRAHKERQQQLADGGAPAGDLQLKHQRGSLAAQPAGDLGDRSSGDQGTSETAVVPPAPPKLAAGQVRELACAPGAGAPAASEPEVRELACAPGAGAPAASEPEEPEFLKVFERKMCRGLSLQCREPGDNRGGARGGGARLRLLAGRPAPPIFALRPEGAQPPGGGAPAAWEVEEALLPLGAITCVVGIGISPSSCEPRVAEVSISVTDAAADEVRLGRRLTFCDLADAGDFSEWMKLVSGSQVVLEEGAS